jgi:NAD(P)-dependent dehydrogenase (short-subunit alcohol dehydrogenase family)
VLDEWAALDGRVAVVTGGAGGLGLPITLDLARAGVKVAVCDRDPAAVEAVTAQLAALSSEFMVECMDVRDLDALAAFFQAVDDRLGGPRILVNVPGGSYRQPALALSRNGISAVIQQNFVHVLEASRLAATRMRAQATGGSIVTVSTIEAHRAMPDMAVYGAMKAAVEQVTRTLAVEWGPDRIRVNTVAPDHFPTPNSARLLGRDLAELAGQDRAGNASLDDRIVIPLGRKGHGREVSACVLFLASDLASYVTGTTLHVDGGTLAAAGWLRWPDGYSNMIPPSVIDDLMSAPAKPEP